MKTKWHLITVVLIVSVFMFSGVVISAGQKPKTVAELALYKGADRQQILEQGAKKEGKLVFYTTGTQAKYIVKAFQKKYPYIKLDLWRSSTSKLIPRIREEYKTGRHVVDVIGPTQVAEIVLQEAGLLQPFYSPELAHIEEDALIKAPGGGVFSAGHFQSGIGLGYNTNLIKKNELPKTYQDILDPKWKQKLAIVGSSSGVHWMGCFLAAYGEEFVRKMAEQQFEVHMISGRALNDMIIAGEYDFSPTIFDSHVGSSKKKGAPVEWTPLEPVPAYLGQIMLPKRSAHPHAAMLYIDFDISREAGEIYKAEGYNSPRKDVFNPRPYTKYYGFKSTAEVTKLHKLFNELFLKK
ncbi:ABC transporter substrate-binding protein [Thermodesulfobacteriota bacterium]